MLKTNQGTTRNDLNNNQGFFRLILSASHSTLGNSDVCVPQAAIEAVYIPFLAGNLLRKTQCSPEESPLLCTVVCIKTAVMVPQGLSVFRGM